MTRSPEATSVQPRQSGFLSTAKNIGDLLNTAGVTWGNFAGGFNLHGGGPATCFSQTHTSVTGAFGPKVDYIPHHEGFQYYASTANPTAHSPEPRSL